MDTSNILQGLGLFVCVGAILVIVVIAFAVRSLMSRRNQNTQQQPTIWNTRGPEQPTYDDRDVQTRGGFGNAPSSGQSNQPGQGSGFGQPRVQPPPAQPRQSSGFGGTTTQGTNRPNQSNTPRRTDDDDIRSSGGFGGG